MDDAHTYRVCRGLIDPWGIGTLLPEQLDRLLAINDRSNISTACAPGCTESPQMAGFDPYRWHTANLDHSATRGRPTPARAEYTYG